MSSQQQQHQLPATATASDTTNRYITSTDRPHSPSTNSNPNQTVKISLEPLTESVYFDTKVLTFSPGQEIRISGSRNQREALDTYENTEFRKKLSAHVLFINKFDQSRRKRQNDHKNKFITLVLK